jgi:DNA-binding NarL/FixJ family response regulator
VQRTLKGVVTTMQRTWSAGEIVLADPDEHSRVSIAEILRGMGHEPVAVDTGEAVLALARERQPVLVILEVCLPGLCGYDVCNRLRDEYGETLSIILLSGTRTASFDRVAGILLGADEVLAKPVVADEFLARVRRLLCRSGEGPSLPRLTARESEVLGLLGDGLTHKQIAHELGISHKTAGTHIEHIFSKLGVHNRMQAVAFARRRGLSVGHA